jgi:3-oxoacyl-[acyl-carrier protein] reductase
MKEPRRIALVTGAGAGIGAAIAARLARDGCMVIAADINEQSASETAKRLTGEGLPASALQMDVGDAASIAAGFASVAKRHERCDILVNNAGVGRGFPFLDYPLEDWHRTMAINVTGTMLCGQHAARLMKRHGWGRIVNVASASGFRASLARTAYGTSKAAVIGLTRQMAVELAPLGITANAIAPGPVDTPMTREFQSPVMRKNLIRGIPAGRYGTPEEMAAMVSFLASEDAAYVTGHTFPVDGGLLAAGVLEI